MIVYISTHAQAVHDQAIADEEMRDVCGTCFHTLRRNAKAGRYRPTACDATAAGMARIVHYYTTSRGKFASVRWSSRCSKHLAAAIKRKVR